MKVCSLHLLINNRHLLLRRLANEHYEALKDESKGKLKALSEKLEEMRGTEAKRQFTELEELVCYGAQSMENSHLTVCDQDQRKPPEERWTAESVAAILETEQAKLDLNHATDSGVIETFEAREREVSCT
jgi:hypothetical protein